MIRLIPGKKFPVIFLWCIQNCSPCIFFCIIDTRKSNRYSFNILELWCQGVNEQLFTVTMWQKMAAYEWPKQFSTVMLTCFRKIVHRSSRNDWNILELFQILDSVKNLRNQINFGIIRWIRKTRHLFYVWHPLDNWLSSMVALTTKRWILCCCIIDPSKSIWKVFTIQFSFDSTRFRIDFSMFITDSGQVCLITNGNHHNIEI